MKDHFTCPNSGALIFRPSEGEAALEQIKHLTQAMMDMAQAMGLDKSTVENLLRRNA